MTSGTVGAVLSFTYAVSFALLLFSGPLVDSAPAGTAMLLLSAGLSTFVVAATSSFRFAVGGQDSAVIAVLAALVAGLTASVAADSSRAELELLVFVALAGTTLFVGAMLLLFGALRLGIWIRYVPFPVIAGFLTASGVVLVLGSMRLLVGHNVTFGNLPDLSETRVALPVGLAIAMAAILAVARKRWRHPMVLPAVLLGGALLIDAGMWALGVSPGDARALGLLMQPVETDGFRLPWVDAFSVSVNVGVLFDHASEVVVATAVTAIAILLNATALEISQHTQGDLDRELRSNGFANLVVGACGGVISNISLNRTQANIAAGATSRWSAIVNGGLCLAAVLIGARVIEWVPTPVVASLLIYLGGLLIWDWLVRPWSRLTSVDIALVTAIPVLAVERGYLEATGLGVVASCIIFALNYSRMRVVKHDLTRREYSSHVDRSPQQTECLKSNGDLIHIMWVQGYLFFGTANWLFEGGKARLKGTKGRPVRYLILDLSNVIGIDSSSILSFLKLSDQVKDSQATLLLSGIPDGVRKAFVGSKLLGKRRRVVEFAQVDHALEWAEEQILLAAEVGALSEAPFESWLDAELGAAGVGVRLVTYLEAVDLERGAELFRAGDAADSLYFVVSGRVSVVLHRAFADPIRLRTMTGYTVVGEMGLYRGQKRSASAVADEPSRVYRLTREALERMERDEPKLSSAFHSLIVRILSDRLAFATTQIAALQR